MKDVLIKVTSLQRDAEGQEEKIELVTDGSYDEKDGIRYLTYDESELTGLSGTQTVIKLYSDYVALARTGDVMQHQEFHPGQKDQSWYETPFGTMALTMRTYEMEDELVDGIGRLRLTYDVELEGVRQNYNELIVDVREDVRYGV